ncbi:MAG TPA: hypothetical protein PKX38_07435 [Alphaproteobacteria bacterium]|jgi:hypothetical protein|nr:hypothetical protein [Micavibrio sp.]MBK9563120.1 hypothetical protein [Micavibrio sp.]HQX27753.1 hypothetical protein [Alphaproteobacteria bacterium]
MTIRFTFREIAEQPPGRVVARFTEEMTGWYARFFLEGKPLSMGERECLLYLKNAPTSQNPGPESIDDLRTAYQAIRNYKRQHNIPFRVKNESTFPADLTPEEALKMEPEFW